VDEPGTDQPRAEQHDNLLRAVERFAQSMEAAGMPRMAARVFAFALADDADRYTAAELAEGLRVSPAAISGAVRYLVDARLLFKEREPGLRSELFRVYDDDVWRTIMLARMSLLKQWQDSLDSAIALIGDDGRGGRRLVETKEFLGFMHDEIIAMLDRWAEHRRELVGRSAR
jgi:DNA-binding transcriptional ArsR family regulator